jgi:uncharacterized protein YecE (DUF72 family)
MAIHIGTSGWSYDHWQGVLYPQQLLPRLRLDYYSQHYHTVEVNSTYYRWPTDSTFASWRQRLPDGFLMSVKAPRGLTHSARLYAPEKWLESDLLRTAPSGRQIRDSARPAFSPV